MTRKALVASIADDIEALNQTPVRRVAIDGVDGAGKTHFADELATELRCRNTPVIRASVDGFHQPRHIRHQRGRNSPEGFYRDSYDYESLIALLLNPLSPGGNGEYVSRVYDVEADQPVKKSPHQAVPGAVLVFDGIFTHRPELRPYWDYSIWLEVPFTTSIPRAATRGNLNPDPNHPSNHRYTAGQRLYIAECDPQSHATIQIDNTNLTHPTTSAFDTT
ncbi:MAG TPA: uridine kinase [Pseudonocardiaceae bacterium]|jgi:uridine kinase|nr:uridine kinase [Pseudonocardiaceae bacterium]